MPRIEYHNNESEAQSFSKDISTVDYPSNIETADVETIEIKVPYIRRDITSSVQNLEAIANVPLLTVDSDKESKYSDDCHTNQSRC